MKIPKHWKRTKEATKAKYAWPGGYAFNLVMGDCEVMCIDCARSNFKLICRSTFNPDYGRDWQVLGPEIHWEGPPLLCANCYKELPSEYGDPDGDPAPQDTGT